MCPGSRHACPSRRGGRPRLPPSTRARIAHAHRRRGAALGAARARLFAPPTRSLPSRSSVRAPYANLTPSPSSPSSPEGTLNTWAFPCLTSTASADRRSGRCRSWNSAERRDGEGRGRGCARIRQRPRDDGARDETSDGGRRTLSSLLRLELGERQDRVGLAGAQDLHAVRAGTATCSSPSASLGERTAGRKEQGRRTQS